MKSRSKVLYLRIVVLSIVLQISCIHCFQRLLSRKLTSDEISSKNFNDIRSLVSASLISSDPVLATGNYNKRDASSEDKVSLDNEVEDNVAVESKDSSVYEDDPEEEDTSVEASQLVNSDYVKDVVKREARNTEDYDEDDFEENSDGDSPIATNKRNTDISRSVDEENPQDVRKNENVREIGAIDADRDYEKQIEDQIQQKIDKIKDDIKREIEKKQQVREIEANNAKYDELEFRRDNDDEVDDSALSDSAKRSILDNTDESKAKSESDVATRSKRRSDLDHLDETKDDKTSPVKKRSYPRRVTLVERKDTVESQKRKERSAILIPERGHAEVQDDLPSDLTLDPNLRLSRSYEKASGSSGHSRSVRSALRREESPSERYRRDMSEELENDQNNGLVDEIDEVPEEASNFLFTSRAKSEPRNRRRRSRGRDRTRSIDRGKGRKHPRHSRRHRATRESSMDDDEERDKRAMSMDQDAALEYKESFGGFPSESGGVLGRFKRIRRDVDVS